MRALGTVALSALTVCLGLVLAFSTTGCMAMTLNWLYGDEAAAGVEVEVEAEAEAGVEADYVEKNGASGEPADSYYGEDYEPAGE